MTKSDIEKELGVLKTRLEKLEERAILDQESAQFLVKQSEQLLSEGCAPETSDERRDEIVKQMMTLQAKLTFELKHAEDDIPEMNRILNRTMELQILWNECKQYE